MKHVFFNFAQGHPCGAKVRVFTRLVSEGLVGVFVLWAGEGHVWYGYAMVYPYILTSGKL